MKGGRLRLGGRRLTDAGVALNATTGRRGRTQMGQIAAAIAAAADRRRTTVDGFLATVRTA